MLKNSWYIVDINMIIQFLRDSDELPLYGFASGMLVYGKGRYAWVGIMECRIG